MQRNDEQVDRIIGVLLRTGVIMAASVVAVGGVWYLARFGMLVPNYKTFHGEPQELRSAHHCGPYGSGLEHVRNGICAALTACAGPVKPMPEQ
jgi:uncharacterized membrane protein